jgi:endonuclease/exonuclease/phosphatase family metal-dependent hydrolase
MTYNILIGARYREALVTAVIDRCDPDVLALQEVTNLALVRRLAKESGMTLLVGKPSDPATEMHNVILTRLPVRRWKNHRHPGRMLRSHLEADLDVTGSALGPTLRIHCLHLAARFGEKANGEVRRMRELDGFFADRARLDEVPHLLVGDLNAVAPEDTVASTRFFAKMGELRRAGVLARGTDGLWRAATRHTADAGMDALWRAAGVAPHLDVSVPQLPGAVFSLTRRIPRGHNVDRLLGRFIERWSIERIRDAGYIDCFRRVHPRAVGYTCATWIPVSRIDYVFASPEMAPHLDSCDVVGSRAWPDPGVLTASDHWPLVADFAI